MSEEMTGEESWKVKVYNRRMKLQCNEMHYPKGLGEITSSG